MSCRICDNTEDTRILNLFVSGSEGLEVCHPCEMALVQHVLDIMHMASRARLSMVRTEKKERKEREAIREIW